MSIPGEYPEVATVLEALGHGAKTIFLNQLSLTPVEAVQLVMKHLGPVEIAFRGYRGRCRMRNGKVSITLPAARHFNNLRSDKVPYLRVGLVLHEIAHAKVFLKGNMKERHGIIFVLELAKLIDGHEVNLNMAEAAGKE